MIREWGHLLTRTVSSYAPTPFTACETVFSSYLTESYVLHLLLYIRAKGDYELNRFTSKFVALSFRLLCFLPK